MCNRLNRTVLFLDSFLVFYFPSSVVILSLLRFVSIAPDDVKTKSEKQVDPNCVL